MKHSTRCLAIPEVLDCIFSFNNSQDNSRCARVCHRWKRIALEPVWRVLNEPTPLLELLAPIKREKEGNCWFLKFERILDCNDWKRLDLYSGLVKRLALRDIFALKSFKRLVWDTSVFVELARTRPSRDILPNLKDLSITSFGNNRFPLQYSVLFMHSRIKHMEITLRGINTLSESTAVNTLTRDLAARSSALEQLELTVCLCVGTLELDFVSLLLCLRLLKVFRYSSCTLTAKVLSALASLPAVRRISLIEDSYQSGGNLEAVLSTPPTDIKGSFERLCFFDIQGDLRLLNDSLFCRRTFSNLKELSVDMARSSLPDDFERCIGALAAGSPLLEKVVFTREEDIPTRELLDGENEPITAQTIRALRKLKHLRAFGIVHSRAILISNEELLELLSACGALEVLILNCEPMQASETRLTLGILTRLSELPNRLKRLSLYIDASAFVASEDLVSCETQGFLRLQSISFGTSPFVDGREVGLFLSGVLPDGCEVDTDSQLSADMLEDMATIETLGEVAEEMGSRRKAWFEVKELLGFFNRARINERKRCEGGK